MKAGLLFGLLGVGTAATIVGVQLNNKAKAANDLKVAFGSLSIKKASFKEGVLMDVVLKATNNSAVELKFTQPFVEVSVLNEKGEMAAIANSNDAQGVVSLAPRKVSDLKFNLQITPAQAIKLPSLVMYLVSQKIKLATGAPIKATKKILVEYGFTAEGINFKQKTDVAI